MKAAHSITMHMHLPLFIQLLFLVVPALSSPATSSDIKEPGDQNCDITEGACFDPQLSITAANAIALPSVTSLPIATNPALVPTLQFLPSFLRKRSEKIRSKTETLQVTPHCTVDANPDIAGIAIRIVFYITASFSVILPEMKNVLFTLAAGTASIEIATLNGIRTRTLSRYHTLIIRTYLTCSVQILSVFGVEQFGSKEHLVIGFIIFMKTLWVILTQLDVDGGGSNPECNHVFRHSPVPFVSSETLSVRGNRIASISLEVLYGAGALYVMRLKKKYPESFVRLKTTWTGSVLFLFSSIIPAIMTIESWIARHQAFVGPGEDVWTFGQIVSLMALLSTAKDVYVHVLERVWFQAGRKQGPEHQKVD